MSAYVSRACAFLLIALVAASCDRTFVDETPPTLEVVAPAFDTVFGLSLIHISEPTRPY